MSPTFRPKQFGPVIVIYTSEGETRFAAAEGEETHSHPPNDKPVLTLLAAVAQCLLESLRIIVKQEGVQLPPFQISASGEKAMDMPGRLNAITCVISGELAEDPREAERLVAAAKAICTVSNTLNCKITVSWARA